MCLTGNIWRRRRAGPVRVHAHRHLVKNRVHLFTHRVDHDHVWRALRWINIHAGSMMAVIPGVKVMGVISIAGAGDSACGRVVQGQRAASAAPVRAATASRGPPVAPVSVVGTLHYDRL